MNNSRQDNPYKKWNKLCMVLILRLPKSFRKYTTKDLINEAYLILSETECENTDDAFAKCINKAFVKLNKEILRANPDLYKWQIDYIKKWTKENKERVNLNRKINYYKKKGRDFGFKLKSYNHLSGKEHPKHIGTYVTPYGEFESTYKFEKTTGICRMTCVRNCKKNVSGWFIKRS